MYMYRICASARRVLEKCGLALTRARGAGCAAAHHHGYWPPVAHPATCDWQAGGGNATLEHHMENENDAQITALLGKVNQLKEVSVQIGNHVREDNKLLNGMGDQFDSSGGLLNGTVKRLSALAGSKDSWHMLYMAIFVVFVFLFIYKMTR